MIKFVIIINKLFDRMITSRIKINTSTIKIIIEPTTTCYKHTHIHYSTTILLDEESTCMDEERCILLLSSSSWSSTYVEAHNFLKFHICCYYSSLFIIFIVMDQSWLLCDVEHKHCNRKLPSKCDEQPRLKNNIGLLLP